MVPDAAELRAARACLREADGLLICAGAGMGVDSGLPDFRGTEGFWKAYPALAAQRLPFYQIAAPAAFRRRPALAWGFYGHRLRLYRTTLPHAGFSALMRLAAPLAQGAFVMTSNVDGQFQRAGFAETHIYECHGSIHRLQCLAPCGTHTWSAESFMPQVDTARCLLRNAPPHCPVCGGLARPHVLMFDDWDWQEAHSQAQQTRLADWLQRVERLVVLEIGAGQAIPTVRRFAEQVARSHACPLLRLNLREAACTLPGSIALAGRACPTLLALECAP